MNFTKVSEWRIISGKLFQSSLLIILCFCFRSRTFRSKAPESDWPSISKRPLSTYLRTLSRPVSLSSSSATFTWPTPSKIRTLGESRRNGTTCTWSWRQSKWSGAAYRLALIIYIYIYIKFISDKASSIYIYKIQFKKYEKYNTYNTIKATMWST